MSDDGPAAKRVLQEGKCRRCGKFVWRERPGRQRWTDQYGRDRCRASWDDRQCKVRKFTEQELEKPERPCSHAGAVPVESLAGKRVAWLCPACNRQMDADWQPPEPLQFDVELTVDSKPDAEIALSAPPGTEVKFYPVTEARSVITIRGMLPPV